MIDTLYYLHGEGFNPFYNLAVEEALTRVVPKGSCVLYLWQNQNTVVIGKNQNAWKECKVEQLQADGGHLARRLSGGGAVFHDLGNLNFTFITHKEDYSIPRQLDVITHCIKTFGLNAQKSGRNDITIGDRKFSGNAFYLSAENCYHHGTLLVDVDMQKLSRYLNASAKKLQSKGVQSVRSRVINLRELNPDITVDALKPAMISAFEAVYGGKAAEMTVKDIPAELIKELCEKYASFDWRLGPKQEFAYSCEDRFDWGEVAIHMNVDKGHVTKAKVYSDSMHPQLIETIAPRLEGALFSSKELRAALEDLKTDASEPSFLIISDIQSLLLAEDSV